MMNYLFDTNIISDLYNADAPNHRNILARLRELKEDDHVYISVLSLYEIAYGLANAPDDKQAQMQEKFSRVEKDFDLLPVFPQQAKNFGQLKQALAKQKNLNKKVIQRYNIDIILAVTAQENKTILVSNDRDFETLQGLCPELEWESW